MTISALILRDDFESAVSAAKAIGSTKNVPGLASPLDAAWSGRINAAWDRIESAFRTAFEKGWDAAKGGRRRQSKREQLTPGLASVP